MLKASRYIPDFDSTSSMLYSLAQCLRRDEGPYGILPKLPYFIGGVLNSLSKEMRKDIYTLAGASEGISAKQAHLIRQEALSLFAVDRYPHKQYPGVMIGSSNGAAVHLAAALSIPWLPQTFLAAVRRKMHPDEIREDMRWGERVVPLIREQNPGLAVHQMHDPVQDRLMVSQMAYFRLKRLTLGQTYEDFLSKRLAPGAAILICECNFKWQVTKIADNHFFQVGGFGDMPCREYLEGSDRVKEFLQKQGSGRLAWNTPEPTQEAPEAEWGFAPELRADIERIAKKRGYKIVRLVFNHPEDVSSFTADFYRWWYEKDGFESQRLLIECFAFLEPLWILYTRSIPFWIAFNTQSSVKTISRHLKRSSPFDQIYLMLVSNAVRGIGTASIEMWKSVLGHARKRGLFLGIDEDKFPYDLGSFIKFHKELKAKIKERHPLPSPLTFKDIYAFLEESGGRYKPLFSAQAAGEAAKEVKQQARDKISKETGE